MIRNSIITIYIPTYIGVDVSSYEFFAQLYAETVGYVGTTLHINFSNCIFFEGNMCAILGSLLEDLKFRTNTVFIVQASPTIRGFLIRNGFIPGFDDDVKRDPGTSTSILYKQFNIEDEEAIKEYVEKELFTKPKLPFVSDQLKVEIIKSIFEIYANAITHGGTKLVFSCGQLLANKGLNFTFVDLGHTIRNKVVEYLNDYISGSEAISWATTGYNTTKTGNHSGGFGLKLIQEFLALNKGKLQIVSGEGFWEKGNDVITMSNMSYSFPGTIVNLIFNLDDKNKYYLASEINATVNNIF